MAEERTESKYAKKLMARKGVPEFRSLGNNENGQEKFLPLPRPLRFDYFPQHTHRDTYPMVREALNTLLPFERPELIAKFRRETKNAR